MNEQQTSLLANIRDNEKIVCFFAVAQPLVDNLVEVIKYLNEEIEKLEADLDAERIRSLQ